LPPLALLGLLAPARAWQAAMLLAAGAALVSVWRLRSLFAATPAPPVPILPPRLLRFDGAESRFLLAIFTFWFGAALNRPILTPYQVHTLGATPAYFALAGAATAVVGLGAQRVWSRLAESGRVMALLGWSGLGAGLAPLLWLLVPTAWVGLPVEGFAAGVWLGHLLGVALRCAQLAPADDERPALLSATHLMQGFAATLAPLTAAALAPVLGARPLLALSGLICLLGTGGLLAGEAAWRLPADRRPRWRLRAAR
ncbi:MAG: hypothetical protein QM692_20940, partial [Thermomicrobiales bacterium]